eukprot:jgi/Botrbrau1/11996/Bobra.247_2s0001.1
MKSWHLLAKCVAYLFNLVSKPFCGENLERILRERSGTCCLLHSCVRQAGLSVRRRNRGFTVYLSFSQRPSGSWVPPPYHPHPFPPPLSLSLSLSLCVCCVCVCVCVFLSVCVRHTHTHTHTNTDTHTHTQTHARTHTHTHTHTLTGRG